MLENLAQLSAEFKSSHHFSPEANIAISAFTLYLEQKGRFMIPNEVIETFNLIRALIYASSPQIEQRNGILVTLDENGSIDKQAARLADSGSLERIRKALFRRPSSISLVVLPDRDPRERYAIAQDVSLYHAFILT